MAYRKEYYVRSKYYSYFNRHGETVTTQYFDTVRKAWEYYKTESAHDFDYGDAWHETEPVQFRWVNEVENTGVLGHSNPIWALDPGFDKEETEHLMSLVSEWGEVPFT